MVFMTISVFTPTHNPKWLDKCLASLQAQTYADWEWVVLLNNGARWETDDSRVRFVISENANAGVGAYKSEAVQYCQGDILVELDHDDQLMPTALEKVLEAFDANNDTVLSTPTLLRLMRTVHQTLRSLTPALAGHTEKRVDTT